jgi:starvation-inducible DNA-binding protein
LGASEKVAITTYAPITFAFSVPLQGGLIRYGRGDFDGKDIRMPARLQAARMSPAAVQARRTARLETPTDLGREIGDEVAAALTKLLADFFALFIKTKNFHWHVSGPHFRDYHLLLDEQASQIYEATDVIAERARKLGGTTIRSIRHVARLQRLSDNDAEFVAPLDMLAELRDDNSQLTSFMREAHGLCDQLGDTATASLLENWIDEAETRVWFLFEASRVNGRSP